MLKQKIFKNVKSSIVSATIDADGDLYFHNIPSKFLLPCDNLYQVTNKKMIEIWQYEYNGGCYSTINWKKSKIDRKTNYGLNFFNKIVSFKVIDKLTHFDLDGTKSITAVGDIILSNETEGYDLNLSVNIFLCDAKLDEHHLEFTLIESSMVKKHNLSPDFDIRPLAENVVMDLSKSSLIIAKYIRARIFDNL